MLSRGLPKMLEPFKTNDIFLLLKKKYLESN